MLEQLKNFRSLYREMRDALPFLDCYVSDQSPAWDDLAKEPPTPFVKLSETTGDIRLLIQTKHTFEEIEETAAREPDVTFIIASGDRKMLYHIEALTRLIKTYPNLYLATGNVCNVCALEDFVSAGLGHKLLYGSMAPFLDPGQALGPVILGHFDWETRCAIAGNNFRRLLGQPPVVPPELPEIKIPVICIDAHGHTIEEMTKISFPPPPKSAPKWEYWQPRLDFFGISHFFATASETNRNASEYPGYKLAEIATDSNGRVRYFEGFDPRYAEACLKSLEKSLPDPRCIGIKIHPAGHRTDGNDPAYEAVFKIAAKYGKPIMTHSWGVSDYNPTQIHSEPAKFECYLKAYPQVTFVFGHTGGRPNGFVQAVEMIKKYPQCMGDFSGDLFFNGHIKHAIEEIGPDRLMFGTDMYWIDPRTILGMLLENDSVSDQDMLKILSLNAQKIYLDNVL